MFFYDIIYRRSEMTLTQKRVKRRYFCVFGCVRTRIYRAYLEATKNVEKTFSNEKGKRTVETLHSRRKTVVIKIKKEQRDDDNKIPYYGYVYRRNHV